MSRQVRTPEEMPLQTLQALIYYNPFSGVLIRKKSGGRKVSGSEAGYVNSNGYQSVFLNGKHYLGHRLAWYLYYEEWPNLEIDHINRRRDDNRIVNLRLVTRSQNMMNAVTPGKRGWHYHSRNNSWQALVRSGGKRIYLGQFETEEEAKGAYLAAVKKYHREFSHLAEKPAAPEQVAIDFGKSG